MDILNFKLGFQQLDFPAVERSEARQLDEFGQVPRQHRADLGRREGLVSRLENQGAAVLRGLIWGWTWEGLLGLGCI